MDLTACWQWLTSWKIWHIAYHLQRLWDLRNWPTWCWATLKLNSTPKTIISDKGSIFILQVTKELNKHLGIQIRLSTAYHWSTYGQSEIVNKAVLIMYGILLEIYRTTGKRYCQWPIYVSHHQSCVHWSVPVEGEWRPKPHIWQDYIS